jgi:hypothetical protein
MCWISLVNSAMYASWWHCFAVHGSVDRQTAVVSGLWSVYRNMNREWRMAWKQASNSLSKAEYLTCVLFSFLEKNPSGCHGSAGRRRCCRVPPMWSAEASTMRLSWKPWEGCTKHVAAARGSLAAKKAARCGSARLTGSVPFGLPMSRSVSGFRILAAAGRNQW